MLKYYIKMAWRNFMTNKLFSVLNLAGLSIGIAICIPLFLFVRNELSFDSMYQNKDRIYRVNLNTAEDADGSETWAGIPNAVAPAMMNKIPGVTFAARMLKNGFGAPASLKVNKTDFKEDNLYWCDAQLFKIFNFNFIEGNPTDIFKDINSIVISKSEAIRLFGENRALGKLITIDNKYHLKIDGVYEDLPANSTIDCSMIANFQASRMSKSIYWSNASYETYCLLDKEVNRLNVQNQLNQIAEAEETKDGGRKWFSLDLQPLDRIHLYSRDILDSYSLHKGDIRMVKNLTFLGLLILLIACINYMNLATARSEKRSKDVGINKTLGASRKQMIWRFYMDTAFISLMAVLLGFLLSFGSIYLFNMVTGKHLLISGLFEWSTFLCIGLLWMFITIIAGSYPALLLSGATALQLMQKQFKIGGLDKLLRKSLVVIQYSASIILIIAVLVIFRQMKFVGEKDLGFNPQGVIGLNLSGVKNADHMVKFRNDLLKMPEIIDAAAIQTPPGFGTSIRGVRKSMEDEDEGVRLYTSKADSHVLKTLGLHLIAGENLPEYIQKGDSTCYLLVNKKVIAYLGLKPQEAIGKTIQVDLGNNSVIVGVLDDFNYASLKDPVEPYLYYSSNDAPEFYSVLLVRLKTAQMATTLKAMENIFKVDVPDAAFDYQFLDARLASLYTSEKVLEKSAVLFSVLAIFVSCLGLFGLSAFMAEQRFKEVGIRKVLGATSFNITRLLSVDFLKLVFLAIIIGIPVAIWLMNSWLRNFTYRIDITWPLIVLATIIGISIAIFTVCFQAIKAAKANPVKSLKTE